MPGCDRRLFLLSLKNAFKSRNEGLADCRLHQNANDGAGDCTWEQQQPQRNGWSWPLTGRGRGWREGAGGPTAQERPAPGPGLRPRPPWIYPCPHVGQKERQTSRGCSLQVGSGP